MSIILTTYLSMCIIESHRGIRPRRQKEVRMSKKTVTQNWRAITAYRMRCNGKTNKEIAEFVGIDVSKVPSRVSLGERLDSLNEKD